MKSKIFSEILSEVTPEIESKVITVQIGNTIYPVLNGWVMFGLGKKINK